jgi:hypothetical protein
VNCTIDFLFFDLDRRYLLLMQVDFGGRYTRDLEMLFVVRERAASRLVALDAPVGSASARALACILVVLCMHHGRQVVWPGAPAEAVGVLGVVTLEAESCPRVLVL